MARRESPTILQEELYPPSVHPAREESPRPYPREDLDDARLVDLDVDEESPFLRAQKRVSARRATLPKKAAHGLLWAVVAACVLGFAALAAAALYHYGERSWRFRVESSDNIEVTGMQNVTKAQIMEVMGADIGRNIFFVPLAQQKAQLEQIPWVESASVMRFVPNRLKVEIHERTPVAFARVGPRIALIDAHGTLMDLPRNDPSHRQKYSFPVILGMNPGEPLSTRAPRMKAYSALISDLDSGGAHYSQDLSEVDLSDLEDLKVRVNDPAGDVLLYLGSSDYLKRYKTYVSHVREWRQQFQKLESVNLRYDNQVVVNPDAEALPKQAQLTLAASKAAAAAGVKPAALVMRTTPGEKAIPKPVFELAQKKPDARSAMTRKPAAKTKTKKTKAGKAHAAKKIVAKATPPKAPVPAATQKPAPQAAGKTAGAKPSPAVAKQIANTSSN